ncbi:SIMPL domain-containing protein [Leptolyngbya cf. ectocarpi LEGE 11479]|uniref:SIMPL domain-containing protein n=1 Tax=Leptolyngbya cf. ectocarpi LEGE 11479 TaxID=1828722 RepID=A0A928ZVB7_LEPEC|nr:SIMPL domain-containing protein [Leptolyngbya ectocarpi]MBE9068134.1 SIMPL domain-containing protein [Leptolyngbya cf. ectocarpi LEGE 11479]
MKQIVGRWILPSAGIVLGVTALAVGAINMATIAPVAAQEIQLRVLTVTGAGSESIPATLARVQLGVTAQGETAEIVQQDIAQRSAAVIELLKSKNVDQLQTTGIRLNPQYNYDGSRPRITGYSGSNTVSFQMPTEAVGTLLDDAIATGANQINSVSFVATDDALENARDTALQAATADAQAQADVVLQSLNLNAQEIVGIQVNNATPPTPIPYAARSRQLESAVADVSTPVEGGEQTVNARVTLQIRY